MRVIILSLSTIVFVILSVVQLAGRNTTENKVPGDAIVADRVIDGDTLELANKEKVRYIGIDTPEISGKEECFANAALAKNKELVEGKHLRLVKDVSERDRYGRLLRYVYATAPGEVTQGEEIFVNEYLVREGYALASTHPPDVAYADLFKNAEADARVNNRGLWGECESEGRVEGARSRVCDIFELCDESVPGIFYFILDYLLE